MSECSDIRTTAEAESRARELQNEREKREHELRMAEAGRPAERDERGGHDDQNVDEDGGERGHPQVGPRRPRVETLADRVKRYGSALKQQEASVCSHLVARSGVILCISPQSESSTYIYLSLHPPLPENNCRVRLP